MNYLNHQGFRLFQTESLSLDFMSLKISQITSNQKTILAVYFQNSGFNC
jgi:hypothetical protein